MIHPCPRDAVDTCDSRGVLRRLRVVAAVAAATVFKRLRGSLQWRALWLRHDKFIVGVAGVVTDGHGRVLLLRHRYWTRAIWGLPSGYVSAGETWEECFAREVREETGIEVEDVRILGTRSGFRLRVEVYVAASVPRVASPVVDRREVLEARFVTVEELPDSLIPMHRGLIERVLERSRQ